MNQIINGGKRKTRKVNKSFKAWVTFVKKVQKEEKLSYKDAIHRAKIRKDKGEKWMTGGEKLSNSSSSSSSSSSPTNDEIARRRMEMRQRRSIYGSSVRTRPRANERNVTRQTIQQRQNPSGGKHKKTRKH